MEYTWKQFWQEEEGVGVVEILLVLVVLIALVLIFKTQLTALVSNIFTSISRKSQSIYQ